MVTYISDAFNRANGPIGSPDSGGPYTTVSGAPVISGNLLTGVSVVTFPAAIDLNIKITNVAAVSGGLAFRYVNSTNYWYWGMVSGTWQLQRVQGGTARPIINSGINNAASQIAQVIAKEKVIACYINSKLVAVAEDIFYSVATVTAGIVNTQPTTFDNLLADDDFSLLPVTATGGQEQDSDANDGGSPTIDGFLFKGRKFRLDDTGVLVP